MDRQALIRALRDTAQSASNAVASNVSGPVDLLAAGLRGVGLPIPESPVGGSQWMRDRGLTAPVQQGAAQVVGETLGMAGPALAANFAPQIARAANSLDDKAMDMARQGIEGQMVRSGFIQPATVWHGSPHKFDKFDSSKIGTGEGAQAYGHGLYLAESPEVAQGYRAAVSADKGKAFGLDDGPTKGIATLIAGRGEKGEALARKAYASLGDQLEPTIAAAKRAVDDASSLYKVDLPDDQIAKMLDWDKPLSQQAPEVQAIFGTSNKMTGAQALKAIEANPDQYFSKVMSGKELTGAMIRPERGSSEYLKKQGIPGIRYLDGGSRGAGGGTSNFVVFPGNEGLLSILERNGQALK